MSEKNQNILLSVRLRVHKSLLRRSPKAFRRPNLSSVQRRLSVINRVYSKQASVRTKAHSAYPPPRRRLCRMQSNQHLGPAIRKILTSAKRPQRNTGYRWTRLSSAVGSRRIAQPCRTHDFRARNAGRHVNRRLLELRLSCCGI